MAVIGDLDVHRTMIHLFNRVRCAQHQVATSSVPRYRAKIRIASASVSVSVSVHAILEQVYHRYRLFEQIARSMPMTARMPFMIHISQQLTAAYWEVVRNPRDLVTATLPDAFLD